MYRKFKDRFGTAGLVIAVVALVAALAGTAIAAGGLTKQQEKQVKKIAKKYAGKPGATGPQGPVGPAGAKGDAGAAGKDGTNGTNGTNGVSPNGTEFAGSKSGHCTEGGVEFKGVNTTYACNGVKGANGQTGFVEALPAGESLYGTWEYPASKGLYVTAAISFGIAYPGDNGPEVNFVPIDGSDEKCPGTAEEPLAEPGHLCVYESAEFVSGADSAATFVGAPIIGSFGAVLGFKTNSEFGFSSGTWAVTAPVAG
jgi:hypothetical protein